jgi:hypothetical protein
MIDTAKTYVIPALSEYPYTTSWQPQRAPATTQSSDSPTNLSGVNELKDQITMLHDVVASLCKTVNGLQKSTQTVSDQITSKSSPCMASPADTTLQLTTASDMDISFEYLRRSIGKDTRTDTIMMLMHHRLKVGELPMGNDSRYAKYTHSVIDHSVRNSTEDKLN